MRQRPRRSAARGSSTSPSTSPSTPRRPPATSTYDAIIGKLHGELDQLAGSVLAGSIDHRLNLNTGDSNPYRGKRCYLLGTGFCLEFGEEGFVGRGNTPAGYIPLHQLLRGAVRTTCVLSQPGRHLAAYADMSLELRK